MISDELYTFPLKTNELPLDTYISFKFLQNFWITGHSYNTHRTPITALNIKKRNESVATDTGFSDFSD